MNKKEIELAIQALLSNAGLSWCDECEDFKENGHEEWTHDNRR